MTDIFDEVLAEQGTKPEAEAEATETEQANPPAETAETNADSAKTILTLPVGEAPEGAVPVAEFAKLVNEKLVAAEVERLMTEEGKTVVEAAVAAMNAQVSQANFYQAVKAQRNPLPHYEVRYNVPVLDENGQDTGETKVDTKVFIPVEAGLEFWKNRPVRGSGAAAASEETVEKRLIRAGKKKSDLDAAQKRLAKLTATVERMKTQLAKYTELLSADGKTIDEAVEAYEKSVEDAEGEAAEGENE